MNSLALSPRYRLDDDQVWLEGIDPSRHYWIQVNSDPGCITAIPGLCVDSFEEFKSTIRQFRALQCGDRMILMRSVEIVEIHCISENCFAIEGSVSGATVWHLFDRETLESLLMTAHPDWHCSQKDLDLGRRILMRCWKQSVVA